MKVSRRHGRLRMRLEPMECELLLTLLDELEAVLAGGVADGADDVRERLYPNAYLDDPDADTEYRTLTESSLRTEREERIGACRAELARGEEIDLAEEEAGRRWIQVLNDLRLALGTRLGITEDDDHDVDPTDPEDQARVIYYWLTAVQDGVVQGLMR